MRWCPGTSVTTGAGLLSSDETGAGLHLYATHPELQIGPLTFLAAAPLNGLATWLSGAIAAVTIAASAPAMLQSLSRLPGLTISTRQRGLAAAVLMPGLGRARGPLRPSGRRTGPGTAHGRHTCGSSFSAPRGGLAVGGVRWRQTVGVGLRTAAVGPAPVALAPRRCGVAGRRGVRLGCPLSWQTHGRCMPADSPSPTSPPRPCAHWVSRPPQPRPGIVPSSCSSGSSLGRSQYIVAAGWWCLQLCWRYGWCLTQAPTRTTPPGWCWPPS